ncbi:MAG: hypothetical protein K9J12_12995 [Melioribacteraceae bacterium]|nr:hypothetical protein [Melioribacteraceae bacterium]
MQKLLIFLFCSIIISCTADVKIEDDLKKEDPKFGTFSFEKSLTLPGNPDEIFDAATGDISGWWDHTFSGNPIKFYIDPKPGGGFYEIFDEEGNGVLHATVIGVDKGKFIRMEGPLGLAGMAIQMVFTYEFVSVGEDSTNFKVSVNASGQMTEGIDKIVEGVWDHFIFERFQPYIEAGKHK